MKWGLGTAWGLGSFWGKEGIFCDLVEDRVLVQMGVDVGERFFRDLLCCFGQGFDVYLDVVDAVEDAFALDLAVGVQLDAIGSVVGLPRQGYEDTRYRVFLDIQIELLLSASSGVGGWTGTHENIIRICRAFIAPSGAPVTLFTDGEYNFSLSVLGVSVSELAILAGFICRAIYAGVFGQIVIVSGSLPFWASDSVVVTNGAVWASDSVVVAPSTLWAMAIPIGTCEQG